MALITFTMKPTDTPGEWIVSCGGSKARVRFDADLTQAEIVQASTPEDRRCIYGAMQIEGPGGIKAEMERAKRALTAAAGE